MNGRRAGVLVLLLTAAVAATAQTPTGSGGYVSVAESECWRCHGPGNWTPDMDPVVAFAPEPASLVPGERLDLGMEVYNAWIVASQEFELSGFVASLDLEGTPSLRAVSDKEDVHIGPVDGAIPFDPAQPAEDLRPGQYGPLLTNEHRGAVAIDVPTGATDVLITIAPTETGPGAPDLAVALYPGKDEPSGFPAYEMDAVGPGETETFHLDDTAVFDQYGFGTWAVEAATRIVDTEDGTVAATQGDIGFTVQLHAWFNASSTALATSDAVVFPGESVRLQWDIIVVEAPAGDETLRGELKVSGHYEHTGPEPDDQDFSIPFEVPLRSTDTWVEWGPETDGVVLEQPPFLPLSLLAELIGYLAAFLVLASMWTGGIFGRASRQRQNRLFGTAKRRVAFHNFLSYAILLFAVIHLIMFLVEVNYHWALGLIWGGLGILALLGLGVTGALQVPMIRRWSYGLWKWIHFGLAIATVVFSLVHVLLDGTHFGDLQESLGWVDPLVPEGRQ